MAGQIIIVSGASGAGKSTTCERFARRSSDFYLLFGIDHFLAGIYPAAFGQHGPLAREGIYAHPIDEQAPDGPLRWSFGEKGWAAIHAFHEWLAAASRAGCNIIIDHLLLTDPPVLQDCIWRLEGLPVLLVLLKPPYQVLEQRVATRENTKKVPAVEIYGEAGLRLAVEKLQRLRPWFHQSVYANDCVDLEIDTVQHDSEAVCALIDARLARGPGTAFDALRLRHGRPDANA